MNWTRKKAQPKEWGDTGSQVPIETEQFSDEWEVRQLTRQKMVGWGIPYDLYPTLFDAANRSDESGPGMIEMVAIYVGRCMLTSDVLCSKVFTDNERRQFVREELLSMYRDREGTLFMSEQYTVAD